MSQKSLPIFSIVGTTSVGKSEAAIALAEYALQHKIAPKVCIISADSRQVYRGLEILTGADLPHDFMVAEDGLPEETFSQESALVVPQHCFQKHSEIGIIEIYGISILSPFEEWSVGRFNEYARSIIAKAQDEQALVLVVGGTGLYHKHLLTTDPRLFIPPNTALREQLQQKTIAELQARLQVLNPSHFAEMNNSDRYNPRRLQRAIEVEEALKLLDQSDPIEFDALLEKLKSKPPLKRLETTEHHFFGLQISLAQLHHKIEQRVKARFKDGAVDEVRAVLHIAQEQEKKLPHQVESTLGFSEVKRYLNKEISADECQQLWVQADFGYSKRQLTWWKKYGAVKWFNREQPVWLEQLLAVFKTHF